MFFLRGNLKKLNGWKETISTQLCTCPVHKTNMFKREVMCKSKKKEELHFPVFHNKT